MIDGEWAKTSRKSMAAYLIAEFSTENIRKMLGYTRRAGLTRLYHPEPFRDWGHFTLRPEQFPLGDGPSAEPAPDSPCLPGGYGDPGFRYGAL